MHLSLSKICPRWRRRRRDHHLAAPAEGIGVDGKPRGESGQVGQEVVYRLGEQSFGENDRAPVGCSTCLERESSSHQSRTWVPYKELAESGPSCGFCELLQNIAISYEPDEKTRRTGSMTWQFGLLYDGVTKRQPFLLSWVVGEKARHLRIFKPPCKLFTVWVAWNCLDTLKRLTRKVNRGRYG